MSKNRYKNRSNQQNQKPKQVPKKINPQKRGNKKLTKTQKKFLKYYTFASEELEGLIENEPADLSQMELSFDNVGHDIINEHYGS